MQTAWRALGGTPSAFPELRSVPGAAFVLALVLYPYVFLLARAAFLRVTPAVDFDAGDGEPVDLVFAMAVPQNFTQQHLQLLSELAEQFADPSVREALRQAEDADALARLLRDGRAP